MRLGAERTVLTALGALALLFSACEDDGFISPVTGTLDVRISGLPTGVAASATVTGPRGYSRALTASTTIPDLPVGTYTVAAADVTSSEGRWTPTPVTQDANLTVGLGLAVAEIAYAIATARMAVNITGLPNGVNADVTVTGPEGFTRALTASAPLELLAPGAYTIVAADVTSGGTTYRPAPMTQAVNLLASPTPVTVNVVYAATTEGTGSLTVTVDGLPAGVDAAITVTGPAGYNQQVASTRTLGSLPPGTYTITASAVAGNLATHNPAPATQSVTVAAGATATGTVTYTATALGLSVQQVAQGLTNPVYLTAPANDSRLFIVEQPGRIRIFKNGALLAAPFLDITSIVQYGGEEGLLSVAFDPTYATNGRFYVYYTDKNGDIAVARYTATPTADVADAGSRASVITIPHPGQSNHNGGLAMFGPDGMLYLGTGDGGGAGDLPNNAQNVNTLLGKLLRLNVAELPYTIPAGNPFVGVAGADEIWAFGLRNPWRYAFDTTAGQLFIADVGQNSWEEVNVVPATVAARNYGWRIMEGTHCHNPAVGCNQTGLTLPVHEYDHSQGCSITGGFVYRGAAIPELRGHYLYSDYCTGFLRSFRVSGGSAVDHRTWSIGNIGNILSFGVDAAGEVYMLSANGGVYRIVRS
jgi:glucose/arabinose dehydrogenase